MLIILILAGAAAPVYAATCTGNHPENGAMTFQLPASITVEPDVSVGTIIMREALRAAKSIWIARILATNTKVTRC